ncbi:histidinol-phosphatase [Nereida sp. MMG025]|uniref:histidinol-phosphatase n=1 Tax=Nereida sp. MMG025 TaxID=2909981 RepID=UPI001F01F0D8|nr:histidinol-phosphatase [Nereida sp. MMG025]MCF6443943.1 histidinol-phosphatase [Nereida sp. MMG025]
MTTASNDVLIAVAHEMADAARQVILPFFRNKTLTTDNKAPADFDPVTEADRAAERAMRDVLAARRPDDGILGEEYGAAAGTSGLTWVLDPIDGTRGFISGTPTWGVLIAVQDAHGPIYGIIDQPYIGERFEGGLGISKLTGPHGTMDLQTRDTTALDQATILTTFPEVGRPEEAQAFHALARQTQLTRYGMDCYGYALVAAGQVDLVVEAGLNAYDIAAPIAVVQAAGGIVTNWSGGPAHEGGQVLAAATAQLHAAALAVLGGDAT